MFDRTRGTLAIVLEFAEDRRELYRGDSQFGLRSIIAVIACSIKPSDALPQRRARAALDAQRGTTPVS